MFVTFKPEVISMLDALNKGELAFGNTNASTKTVDPSPPSELQTYTVKSFPNTNLGKDKGKTKGNLG